MTIMHIPSAAPIEPCRKPAPKKTLQRAVSPPETIPVYRAKLPADPPQEPPQSVRECRNQPVLPIQISAFDDIRDPKEKRLLVRGVIGILAAVALVVALGWFDVLGRLA